MYIVRYLILLVILFACSLSRGQDTLYIAPNAHFYTFPKSNVAIYGNIVNDAPGGFNHNNGGDVYLFRHPQNGKGNTVISDGPLAPAPTDNYNKNGAYLRFWNLHTNNTTGTAKPSATLIDKDSGSAQIQIAQEIRITHRHSFEEGIIWTPRSKWKHAFVHYDSDTATYTGNADTTHIDGYAAKTGCSDFIFPIGDGIHQRRSGIAGPGCGEYRSAYFNTSPQNGTTGISGLNALSDSGVNCTGYIRRVSRSEFWDLDGTSSTNITLEALNTTPGYSHWDSTLNFSTRRAGQIVISGFNAKWQNLSILDTAFSLTDDGFFTSTIKTTPDTTFSAYTWAVADTLDLGISNTDGNTDNNYLRIAYNTSSIHTLYFSFGNYAGNARFMLKNMAGQVLQKQDVEATRTENKLLIDMRSYPSGIYIVQVATGNAPYIVLTGKIYNY